MLSLRKNYRINLKLTTAGILKMKYKRVSNGKYKYELTEHVVAEHVVSFKRYHSEYMGLFARGLYVWEGYQWDGATLFPDFECIIIPSCAHDAFYQLMRLGEIPQDQRIVGDRLLRDMIDTGGWYKKVMSKLVYAGVRMFGGKHAMPAGR